ncbi:MAG: PilZ domain-containing protein [Thermodesulfovibrionales bacterium]|nr:PilZ domain-containing protein [Thermodesulfovibrionales bacterium]
MFDQRKQERFDISCPIEYVVDSFQSDVLCEGIAVNISNSGLCLLTSHSFTEGQEIAIKSIFPIPLPSEAASVVWVEKSADFSVKTGLSFSRANRLANPFC